MPLEDTIWHPIIDASFTRNKQISLCFFSFFIISPHHSLPIRKKRKTLKERRSLERKTEIMGCAHFESSDPWTSSNTVSQEHGGGIQETWREIKNHGGGRECFAGEKLEKRKSQVLLEGYVEAPELDDDDLTRAKSLTDDDLEELKGCLDLGFGFSYNEIPVLCNTLPALELCYSMSQKFLDEKQKSPEISPVEPPPTTTTTTTPVASWKISSPGDNPDDVKARLKYWAQAVACTVRLCS